MVTRELADPHRQFEAWPLGALDSAGYRLTSAWAVRRSLPVRLTGVDVVRVCTSLATDVLRALDARGLPRGPVLANRPRRALEIFVPAGTSEAWPDLDGTRCVRDPVMRFPAPSITADSGTGPVDQRLWLTPPARPPAPSTTDGDALAEAVGTALARTRAPHISGRREAQP